jgi:phospholipase A1
MYGKRKAYVLLVLMCASGLSYADDSLIACKTYLDDVDRLHCYDAAQIESVATESAVAAEPATPESLSMLSRTWQLDKHNNAKTFQLLPHHANYLLPIRYTDKPNLSPSSPTANHQVPFELPIDNSEAKFQLSVKVKILDDLWRENIDLWFAYTQQSNWQVYNTSHSAAFRETNYQPEAILTIRTRGDVLGWQWRLLNLGFIHESNGRALPTSRSWNRVYGEFGLEKERWTMMIRPWLRIPETAADDDNPDIRDYFGSSDVRVAYAHNEQIYSALGRFNPKTGRGAIQLDWTFPISGSLKGYVQLTSGYGESLVDYNHAQNTLGLGLLLLPF